MTSHVELQIQARIAAARAKAEADKRRRQEFAEARQRGLAARHAQKLSRKDEFCDGCNGTAPTQDGITHDPWCTVTCPRTPAVDRRPATLNDPREEPR